MKEVEEELRVGYPGVQVPLRRYLEIDWLEVGAWVTGFVGGTVVCTLAFMAVAELLGVRR